MNLDTPLIEVAAILPTSAAKMLDGYAPPVQVAVLGQVRVAVAALEATRVDLDPVQLSAVLDLFVGSLIPYADGLYRISQATQRETP